MTTKAGNGLYPTRPATRVGHVAHGIMAENHFGFRFLYPLPTLEGKCTKFVFFVFIKMMVAFDIKLNALLHLVIYHLIKWQI